MMSWYWHAGYVQLRSQSELADAIQKTMERAAQRKISRVSISSDHPDLYYFTDPRLFLAVGFQENGWTPFWGGAHRFCSNVFQANNLSGLLVSGHDALKMDPHRSQSNSWDYIIWEHGVATQWFVSNPRFRFREWDIRTLKNIVGPYLQRKGVKTAINDPELTSLRAALEELSEAFAPDVVVLRRYAKASIGEQQLIEWHSFPTIQALTKLPDVIDIPFIGLDYTIADIAVYLDLERGLLSAPQDLHSLNRTVKKQHERSPEWQDLVSKFLPIRFVVSEGGDYTQTVLQEFAPLFFYQ